jgi:hypothetical protein
METLMDIFSAEDAAEKIISLQSTKKLGTDSHESWFWKRCFAGKCEGIPVREYVKKQIMAGAKVKAGWTATQIRGYHDRWILIKDNRS